jgi:transcription elongation GreA/GreB family factor
MSRAFVKETENDTIVRPDRPASPYRNFVTEAGLAAIEAALSRFETAHRAALESGDRNAAAAALREVRYWGARRASAEVVKTSDDKSKASFGMTVSLRRHDGREQSLRLWVKMRPTLLAARSPTCLSGEKANVNAHSQP